MLKKNTIHKAYSFKRKTFITEGNKGLNQYANYETDSYDNVDEIDEEMEYELNNLDDEYLHLTIQDISIESHETQQIINWIDNDLYEL